VSEGDLGSRLRALPSIDRVASHLDGPHPGTVAAATSAVEQARTEVFAGGSTSFERVLQTARELLGHGARERLQPVLNATGVIVHTNLGRVPMGPAQLDAVGEIAGAYSNLEYDLSEGRRGDRYGHASTPLKLLTGAESAVVVNNCAAAVLLTLTALASGQEVIVARGELIEIGGGFRIPEILESSGARLVEVGTTNRTRLEDYERAITQETAALLKVHPSNYRMVGFTESVELGALARLGRASRLPLLFDLGSGLLDDSSNAPWTRGEPTVRRAIAGRADIVTFSGDKLLGGPQSGIIAGRADLIAVIARHPLIRALRVDKMVLAALEKTLDCYLDELWSELPLWRMAGAGEPELEARARNLAQALEGQPSLADCKVEVQETRAVAGGGTLPGTAVASWGVALTSETISASRMHARLRGARIPIIGRVENDRLIIDLRTILPEDDDLLRGLVTTALS
jgi:L-seryl-tRNA(Ser) seleniumtransferase